MGNDAILSLLKSNTAFVRKGKVVKVVKLDNIWSYYYLASDGTGQSIHKMKRAVKC